MLEGALILLLLLGLYWLLNPRTANQPRKDKRQRRMYPLPIPMRHRFPAVSMRG